MSIGTSESAGSSEPWLPPPRWCRPARSRNSQPGAAETSTSPAFGLRSAAAARDAAVGDLVEHRDVFVAVAPNDQLAVFFEEHDSCCRLRVEPFGDGARVVGVDHAGAVRRGDEIVAGIEARDLLDARLAVVAADHDRVALEELVGTARSVHQLGDRCVAARERFVRGVGAGGVRGVVVVRQVVDERVEAVAGDEPAADRCGVRVDRAQRAIADRHRRAGAVALVERVEEEALRPVDGGHSRNRRQVAVAASVARDVDRACRQSRGLERLVDRLRVRREVLCVQVDDGVAKRARDAGGARGAERRAVLDDAVAPRGTTRRGAGSRARRDTRRSRSTRDRPASATGTRRRSGGTRRARRGSGSRACRPPRTSTASGRRSRPSRPASRQSLARERRPACLSGARRRNRAPSTGTASASR